MARTSRMDLPPNGPTFEVCIDEAGDDGLNCVCGNWMVVSALISPRGNYPKDIKLVREVKSSLYWKEKKPLHFRDLSEAGKRMITTRIANNQHRYCAISVFLHKPSLDSKQSFFFKEKNKLYFYLVRLLLERVSWACRDSKSAKNRDVGNGTARIIFSDRQDLSYRELEEYFVHLESLKTETTIDWDVIRPNQFETLRNGKHPGLQLADTVASAMYCCEHHCLNKATHEWAQILKPAIYHHGGKYHGYGIKIFPPCAERQMAQGALAQWAIDNFKSESPET